MLTRGDRTDLTGATVAVPGDRTTAYLLFRLWAADQPPARIEVVPFHEIMPGVAAGRYDAGLVIHEARFTYPRYGLTALVDLGEWWEARHRPADPARRDPGPPRRGRPGRGGGLDPRLGAAGLGRPGRAAASTCWRTRRRWSPTWSTSTSRST